MGEIESPAVWEHARDWSVMRPFVYYQRENFVPEGVVAGRDIIDYSAGLGDLSIHVSSLDPASIIATAPEPHAPRPPPLPASVEWRTGVGANQIADELPPMSADMILARMVIQFPTVENHDVDVDGILQQMRGVLREGGTIIATTHSFFSLPRFNDDLARVDDHLSAVEADVLPLLDAEEPFTRGVARETIGLIELVRYLDLPPREGPLGRTGFGLKIPMLVNSFVRQGFAVENVEVIEPFTFPIGLQASIGEHTEAAIELGEQVMAVKHRHLTTVEAADPYRRPTVLAAMIAEIRRLLPVTAVPIVRVTATKS
ncbi:MAG: hypothetical protein BMS9Abin07_2130 [Acidimicrobiia bacterium]|nr:MAG: hypothetical protein BMS9Abin07_2130 [Acidimicrobiia bacterium]